MKKITYMLIVMTLCCCKDKTTETKTVADRDKGSDVKKSKSVGKSRVVVTMDGKEYSSSVTCTYFEHDYFYFKSDKLETTDTNGDGIVINGHQQGNKMAFTLIVDDKEYSAANLGVQKKENTALGAGKLFSGSESFKTTYKVTCNQ